jgi:hypothetical protein
MKAGVVAAGSVGLCAVAVNLIVALAPSTKIDELYYHMLVGRRVAEDGGLRVYQLPLHAATVAQMPYQIAEGVFHHAGMMDLGNLLSWSFFVVLCGLLGVMIARASGCSAWGAGASSCAAVGLYSTVWHTTAGAHAIGDLATFSGFVLVLFGRSFRERWGELLWSAAAGGCAAIAASSKISLWPLSAAMILLAVSEGGRRGCGRRFLVALLPSTLLLLPLLVWQWAETGSPLGPIGSGLFGPSVFAPEVVAELESTRRVNQVGILPAIRQAVISLSPAFFLSLAAVSWFGWMGFWRSRVVLGLFLMQSVLIALFLTHDFRFLGGLQYVVLAVAAVEVWEAGWVRRWFRWRWVALAALTLPWLGTQVYYARPFASVVFGQTTQDQFLRRYVAFHDDFTVVGKTLPVQAVLLIEGYRAPSVYAPRPVVYTVLDWDGVRPLYRMRPTAGWTSRYERELRCGEVVYRNDRAVVETYRTPGREALRGAMLVERCRAEPSIGRSSWERR